jgi:hypothetical protein
MKNFHFHPALHVTQPGFMAGPHTHLPTLLGQSRSPSINAHRVMVAAANLFIEQDHYQQLCTKQSVEAGL